MFCVKILSVCVRNKAQRIEDVWGSGNAVPHILNLGARYESSFLHPGHSTLGYQHGWPPPPPIAGLNIVEKKVIYAAAGGRTPILP
jgi:hypothetical protein